MYKGKPLLVVLAVREHDRGIACRHGFGRGSDCFTQTILSTNESEPFYGGNCGFPLTATFRGESG